MSVHQMIGVLTELGYPAVDTLDAQGLDWLFENEAILPFLEWMCNSLHSSNVLAQDEIDEYNKLEVVLEGQDLDEALQSLECLPSAVSSEEELRAETRRLEKEVDRTLQRKNKLIQKRNMHNLQLTRMDHRLSQVDAIQTSAEHRYTEALHDGHAHNVQMNLSVEKRTDAVSGMLELYSDSDDSTTHFLSRVSLDDYHRVESRFTQNLTEFSKKLFFEGIADMVGHNEQSRYEILEVNDPQSLLLQGKNNNVNVDDCREMSRLQSLLPISETQWINATVEEASVASACGYVEHKLTDLKEHPLPKDYKTLSLLTKDAESLLWCVRRDINQLGDGEVPILVKESVNVQANKILTGDYNLKIMRQDYFINNQDQVIEQLIKQRSRHELLTILYELEARSHRDTHRLLTAAGVQLRQTLNSFNHKMKLMTTAGSNLARHQRNTIDSRDTFLTMLYTILGDTRDEKQLFITYSDMLANGLKLHQQGESLKNSLASVATKQQSQLDRLESGVRKFEMLVYAGSTTSGQPQLSPQLILDLMKQLDMLLKKLEETTLEIIKEVEKKKKTLTNDAVRATERSLFVYFHTNHERLRQVLDHVSKKLSALHLT